MKIEDLKPIEFGGNWRDELLSTLEHKLHCAETKQEQADIAQRMSDVRGWRDRAAAMRDEVARTIQTTRPQMVIMRVPGMPL